MSLPKQYDRPPLWSRLTQLNRDQPALYHFRSIFDIRIFFDYRQRLPPDLLTDYRSMVDSDRTRAWMDQGTENHMFMQRATGLALLDGSGFPNPLSGTAITNEAWLRAELNKWMTIGQGEFHSSTYSAYGIAGLLNLYDHAKTPALRDLAQALLDWQATNIALRQSWGTSGGAESRGFDRGTWTDSSLAVLAWLWWGPDQISPNQPTPALKLDLKAARPVLLAALSHYRPPEPLRPLARKTLPLPFQLRASHPAYFTYSADNQRWETFYITPDYSLGTLLIPERSTQTEGTINAQYATYKLILRDPKGTSNLVASLGGIYHSPLAQSASPGDQYLQSKGTVLYQLRLSDTDRAANIPPESRLVLPRNAGAPRRHGPWFIWQIHNTWLVARPWGQTIQHLTQLPKPHTLYQALSAQGPNSAWITDLATRQTFPTWDQLTRALNQAQVDDRRWAEDGILEYVSFEGERLSLQYRGDRGTGEASINNQPRLLQNWPVLDSPYVQEPLRQGRLSVQVPDQRLWQLTASPGGPRWQPSSQNNSAPQK